MKYTNFLNLPEPLVNAVVNDDYDRGSSDITVTELLSPPRKVALEKMHSDELVTDVSESMWALIGQAVHSILERSGTTGRTEERMYAEVLGWKVGGKFDHHFSNERWGFLSGTYNWADSERLPSDALKALGQGTSPGNNAAISTKHTLGVSHTTTFTPTIVNEFKFGFSWSEISSDIPKPRYDSTAKVDLKDLVFLNSRELVGEIGAPRVTGIGFRTGTSRYGQTSYQYKEGLSIARGNHSYRLGAEIRQLRYLQGSCSRGCNGVFIWNDLRTFLLNQPRQLDTYIPGSDNPTRHLNQSIAGFYFQDNWQMSQSLTLNLGMRYEFVTVPDEDNHLISTLQNLVKDDFVAVTKQVAAEFNNEPRQFTSTNLQEFFPNPTLKSFSPRFGFAWDVNGDGKVDVLEAGGSWEQPKSLEGDPVWVKHEVKFGTGGAQNVDRESEHGIEHLHRIASPIALRNVITAK